MGKLRLRFSKIGRAKYISHLDLMATLQRALIRAEVPIKYSQGFNPHPVMSIALPLSVGCESVCELMDFQTEDNLPPDGLPALINVYLPNGIEVQCAYFPERKFSAIAHIEFRGILFYDAGVPERAVERLNEAYSAKSIVISKKTKSGVSDLDIAPLVRGLAFHAGEQIVMSVRLPAQNPSISPENLLSALSGDLVPDFAAARRIEVYDTEMALFK